MPRRRPSVTTLRKQPRQARSEQLVEAILQAAIRVLERQGAAAFTTIRVAQQAGVSVGSLYQYFPNKESILFRLQQREWAETGQLLDDIFADTQRTPADRLRAAVRAFFKTECDEAPLRRALGDAAPLYRDDPRAQEHQARGMPILLRLIDEAAPGLSPTQRAFAANLYLATLASMGKHVSETVTRPAEVETWADATAEMFLAYLRTQKRKPHRR